MRKIWGKNHFALEIDLTSESVKKVGIDRDDMLLYLGGKGLALKLLYDRLTPKIDPLGADNILIFMTGPLNGTGAPCSARFSGVTKSPLTKIIAHSSCGGPFGLAIKSAGYDGVIIKGKAAQPVRIHISPQGVEFKEGESLWGRGLIETKALLDRDEPGAAFLAIGPAGENMVLYANIASGDRFLGRAGMGAVMGSKNLKAITVKGDGAGCGTAPPNSLLFKQINEKANEYIKRNIYTGALYRKYGTLSNVRLCNNGKILPVRNFSEGMTTEAEKVYGERFQEEYKTKSRPCTSCSILCGHKGTYHDGIHKIPEYETTALLGPNLGVFDRERITEWNDLCSDLGLDTMSLGNTLGFAMELEEKECGQGAHVLKTGLKFGDPHGIQQMIDDIAHRRGQGDELANGTRYLSETYGGKEYAIQVKGLEMAGYDPRGSIGQGLAYAVANRGACHLSASLFVMEVFTQYLKPNATMGKSAYVIFLESLTNGINCLPTCLFTSFAYLLEPRIVSLFQKYFFTRFLFKIAMRYLYWFILRYFIDISMYTKLFEVCTGFKMSKSEFLKAGNRIHTLERYMNTREGISRKDDTLPERFLKEGRKKDPKKRIVPLGKMIDGYYKRRGFDSNGIPKDKTLKELGIEPK